MKLLPTLLLLVVEAYARSWLPSPQYIFSNPPSVNDDFRMPTIHESTVMARRMLHLEGIGTLSSVFPNHTSSLSSLENRPPGLGGSPIGLMEYVADCEPETGNPTILAINIATPFKNADAGSNLSLHIRWHPTDGKWHSVANLPRFSLIGHLERMEASKHQAGRIANCFVNTHPDAVLWLPGTDIHESHWARLVVDEVYWFGGFGDRAQIGWLPLEEWRGVTKDEIDECRLPGEIKEMKSWRDWL